MAEPIWHRELTNPLLLVIVLALILLRLLLGLLA
jgi:hypothetical protein